MLSRPRSVSKITISAPLGVASQNIRGATSMPTDDSERVATLLRRGAQCVLDVRAPLLHVGYGIRHAG
jgi:hypothetical protein